MDEQGSYASSCAWTMRDTESRESRARMANDTLQVLGLLVHVRVERAVPAPPVARARREDIRQKGTKRRGRGKVSWG